MAEAGGEPEDRLLAWPEVHVLAGFSRTTAWRLQQAGLFPACVSLSPGRVGWRESELKAWRKERDRRRWRLPPKPPSGRKRKALSSPAPAAASPPLTVGRLRKRLPRSGVWRVHPDQLEFDF